jgi:hypothetical protein
VTLAWDALIHVLERHAFWVLAQQRTDLQTE